MQWGEAAQIVNSAVNVVLEELSVQAKGTEAQADRSVSLAQSQSSSTSWMLLYQFVCIFLLPPIVCFLLYLVTFNLLRLLVGSGGLKRWGNKLRTLLSFGRKEEKLRY